MSYPQEMRALLPVGLLLACTIPNPAFDVENTTGQTTIGMTGMTGTTGMTGMTGTSGEPTTSEASASTVAPSGTTSEPTSGEASTASTASDTSDTSDTTTGEPGSCWRQKAGGWPLEGTPLDAFVDTNPIDPFITADGLQLHYIAGDPRRPFLSTRAGLDEPFPNGLQQAIWGNDPAIIPAHPSVVLGGQELLFVSEFDVFSAKGGGNAPNTFDLPVPLAPPGTGAPESKITVTADSATLIASRRDGPQISPDFPGPSDRFYQYNRAQLQPGAAYAGGTDVTPVVGTVGLSICPTLSPDGLHLFFSSTESESLSKANAGEVVAIYYTSRPDPSMPWEPAQEIGVAHPGPGIICPSSVTADGCQLAYHRFTLADPAGYSMYLASRVP